MNENNSFLFKLLKHIPVLFQCQVMLLLYDRATERQRDPLTLILAGFRH